MSARSTRTASVRGSSGTSVIGTSAASSATSRPHQDRPRRLSPPSLQRPLESERIPAPSLDDDTPAFGLELIEKFLQCGDGLRAGCLCIFEPEVGRKREGTTDATWASGKELVAEVASPEHDLAALDRDLGVFIARCLSDVAL